jgi:hypothetical protein
LYIREGRFAMPLVSPSSIVELKCPHQDSGLKFRKSSRHTGRQEQVRRINILSDIQVSSAKKHPDNLYMLRSL